MNCTQARQAIHLKLDGELSATDAAALALHCAGCADCRAAADELADVIRALGDLRDATARVGEPRRIASTPVRRLKIFPLTRVAAAIALILGAGTLTYRAMQERVPGGAGESPVPYATPVSPVEASGRDVQVALSAESDDRFIPVAQAVRQPNVHVFVLFERP